MSVIMRQAICNVKSPFKKCQLHMHNGFVSLEVFSCTWDQLHDGFVLLVKGMAVTCVALQLHAVQFGSH